MALRSGFRLFPGRPKDKARFAAVLVLDGEEVWRCDHSDHHARYLALNCANDNALRVSQEMSPVG